MEISNVLNMKSKEKQNLRIESDILVPQYINQTECVFNIRKNGILDIGSRLIIGVKASDGNTQLTNTAGVYAIIRSATLRTSKGVNIAQTQDVDYLLSINNNFVEPSVRERRGVVANGTYQNYQYTNNEDDSIKGVLTYAKNPKGRNGIAADTTDLVQREARFSISSALSSEYSIKLSQLFPELFPFQIPLFLLDDQLQLHLTFTSGVSTGSRGLNSTGVNGVGNVNTGTVNLQLNEVKLHSNHLYFSDDTMDQLRMMSRSQTGIIIPYSDFNLIKNTYSAVNDPAEGASTIVKHRRNLGLSNLRLRYMLVHNLMGSISDSIEAQPNTRAGVGKYASRGPMTSDCGVEAQIVVNNENYYPRALNTYAKFYQELEDVYGIPASIPRGGYCAEGSVNDSQALSQIGAGNLHDINKNSAWTNRVFYGTNQTNNIAQNFIMGFNFATSKRDNVGVGIPIGVQPVEFLYNHTYTRGNSGAILQRIFCCVERMMVIKNGEIMTTNS
tara:strand:- start:6276 stop:7775 length:1500 start_codon:yes stop_codon:yes gene_type:complete